MYVTLEEANDYHSSRISHEIWDRLIDEDKKRRLLSASDFLDYAFKFKGHKVEITQEREWPRVIDNSILMPQVIQYAVCELSVIENLTGILPKGKQITQLHGLALSGEDCCDCESTSILEYVLYLLRPYLHIDSLSKMALKRG